MGSANFETYGEGRDAGTAFRHAVSDAAMDHGRGGYTGTIAEKPTYVVITSRAMNPDEASTLADTLIGNNDRRILDKWGPAGAIAVKQPTRTVDLDSLTWRPGTPASGDELAELTRTARERQLISDTETVTGGYRTTGDGYVATVAKDPAELALQGEPDGWLFFGWASS